MYEYPDGRLPKEPDNWEEIQRRLRQPRRSLSLSKFSEEDHRKFVRADFRATKKKHVITSVIPIIEGNIGDAKCVSGGIPFTNLYHLTDSTIVPGNPDICYGARPEQLKQCVRDELNGFIIPSTQLDLPILPNFFLATKGLDESLAVATRQASYNGSLGARGMQGLLSYGLAEPVLDNNAHTITSIYHGGVLKMYTSHVTQSACPGSRPEYLMHQIGSFAMTNSVETFQQGAMYYRNARDWAKEQRNEAINSANRVVLMSSSEILSTDVPTVRAPLESETARIEHSEQSPSVGGTQYTTPLSGEQTSDISTDLERPHMPLNENTSNLGTNKRSRGHAQESSPVQRKRYRTEDRPDLLPPKPRTRATQ